jgi:CBS domain-containing protein
MSVRAILDTKGRDVATVSADATLAQAVVQLAEKRIGALVVTGIERSVIGILSERDIVRALAAHKEAALARPVAEFMTRRVVTCSADDTVAELMHRMTAGRFRHVPVIEHGRLFGIVSIGDVVKSRVAEIERESEALGLHKDGVKIPSSEVARAALKMTAMIILCTSSFGARRCAYRTSG